MVPGKEGGLPRLTGLGLGAPLHPLPGKHPRTPCLGLDGHHGFKTSSCHSSRWNSPQRQKGVRFRNPHPRKQAATSQETLGCVRSKPQSEHSAKQKLVPRSPDKLGRTPGQSDLEQSAGGCRVQPCLPGCRALSQKAGGAPLSCQPPPPPFLLAASPDRSWAQASVHTPALACLALTKLSDTLRSARRKTDVGKLWDEQTDTEPTPPSAHHHLSSSPWP